MNQLSLNSDPKVETAFNRYPTEVRDKIESLRNLILEVAADTDGIDKLEETLKWGEPSYLTKHGSTIRIDWKAKSRDQYAVYFKCTSKLVPTFKEVFGPRLRYEGNRAIVFKLEEEIPTAELKKCIAAALSYHRLKHLALLGMNVDSPK